MIIRYWQPSREMDTLRRQIDQVFGDLTASHRKSEPDWTPAVELLDQGDRFTLRAQLPGIAADALDIQVSREAVTLAGERRFEGEAQHYRSEFRYGTFRRIVPLPAAIENDQVKADFQNGMLQLTLPKIAAARNKVVKINLESLAPTDAAPEASDQNGQTPEASEPAVS